MIAAVSNQVVLANPVAVGLLAFGAWVLARRYLMARGRWHEPERGPARPSSTVRRLDPPPYDWQADVTPTE